MNFFDVKPIGYSDESKKMIDCMVRFVENGNWMPYTASATDPEQSGRDIYARLISGEFGPVPEPGEMPQVTRWQRVKEVDPALVDGVIVRQWEVYDLPTSLADKRADIKHLADDVARQKRDIVVAGISPAEMASWPIKRAEALAYQSTGTESAAPSLALEAQARGVAIADLAGKVLAKAAQLAALEAGIAGRCGAIQDAAAAAQSDAELLAIDLEAGWPV